MEFCTEHETELTVNDIIISIVSRRAYSVQKSPEAPRFEDCSLYLSSYNQQFVFEIGFMESEPMGWRHGCWSYTFDGSLHVGVTWVFRHRPSYRRELVGRRCMFPWRTSTPSSIDTIGSM